jgi:hypothetical protein
MEAKLVSGLNWRRNHGGWFCNLLYFDGEFNLLPLEPGSHIEFKVMEGKFCIGYTKLSNKTGESSSGWKERASCPYKSQVNQGTRCYRCSTADVMRTCVLCNGGECRAISEIREACQKSVAYVYLASFGTGRIKAGVSRRGRYMNRWIEQGADMAKRILLGDGMEVRRFERWIQRKIGVLNMVRAKQKQDLGRTERDLEESKRLLDEYQEKVYRVFPAQHHFQEDTQFLLPKYRIPKIDRRPLELEVQGGKVISGQVLAVKGPILLVEMNGLPYTVNLNRLIGRKIDDSGEFTLKAQSGLEKYLPKY